MSTPHTTNSVLTDLCILRGDAILQQQVDQVRNVVRLCLLVPQGVEHDNTKLISWCYGAVHDDPLRLLHYIVSAVLESNIRQLTL